MEEKDAQPTERSAENFSTTFTFIEMRLCVCVCVCMYVCVYIYIYIYIYTHTHTICRYTHYKKWLILRFLSCFLSKYLKLFTRIRIFLRIFNLPHWQIILLVLSKMYLIYCFFPLETRLKILCIFAYLAYLEFLEILTRNKTKILRKISHFLHACILILHMYIITLKKINFSQIYIY